MKQFSEKKRFDFRFAMDGYGKNVKKALLNALKLQIERIEAGDFNNDDWEAIEEHEVVSISEWGCIEK